MVYPRVCGGAEAVALTNSQQKGLSRVCGGAAAPTRWPSMAWVYPRVCGGAYDGASFRHKGQGLSPRVRGSPLPRRCTCEPVGSIPACAGEPNPLRPRLSKKRVYPRVCGGAPGSPRGIAQDDGLSPRVRGSLNPVRAVSR